MELTANYINLYQLIRIKWISNSTFLWLDLQNALDYSSDMKGIENKVEREWD